MSRFGRSYEDRREEDRDARRKYEGDVTYEVWMMGGNVDNINFDRVDDNRYDGVDAEDAAAAELRSQLRSRSSENDTDSGF